MSEERRFTNGRIYELTDLLGDWGLRIVPLCRASDVAASATFEPALAKSLATSRGTFDALPVGMNPRAEALKQRTFAFALAVIRFIRVLRKTWEGRELSDQLFRAGTRVGANYRAACRARSHADFVNKIAFVVEEADESLYWLELIKAAEIVDNPGLHTLLAEANELSAIFNQSQLTAKANSGIRRQS